MPEQTSKAPERLPLMVLNPDFPALLHNLRDSRKWIAVREGHEDEHPSAVEKMRREQEARRAGATTPALALSR